MAGVSAIKFAIGFVAALTLAKFFVTVIDSYSFLSFGIAFVAFLLLSWISATSELPKSTLVAGVSALIALFALSKLIHRFIGFYDHDITRADLYLIFLLLVSAVVAARTVYMRDR